MNTIITSHDTDALGSELLTRISEIKSKTEESKSVFPIEFMGKYRDIPLIEVRIGFPVYRLANGRTRTFQREYLALHPDEPKDLFTGEQNSFVAQYAQHQILLNLADEEDLLNTFKKENLEQTEPIICTSDGVVVNGNRRLCAWRELFYKEQEKYKQFQTIRIAVLPECDEDAIEELESKLQIQDTMRAEYHWHTIALMAKEKVENGKTLSEVAKAYGKKEKDIKTLIEARDYAEIYLHYIGKSDQWSLVDNYEYAFEQMVKARGKLESSSEKELFESIVFKIIEGGNYEGRLYELIPEIGKNLNFIGEKLGEELPIPTTDQVDLTTDDQSEAIDLLAGDEPPVIDDASLLANAVRNSEDDETIKSTVQDVIETQKQLEKEKKSKNYLLNQVSKAVSSLQNAINCSVEENDINTTGVTAQLDVLEEKVEVLREWLKDKNENSH